MRQSVLPITNMLNYRSANYAKDILWKLQPSYPQLGNRRPFAKKNFCLKCSENLYTKKNLTESCS